MSYAVTVLTPVKQIRIAVVRGSNPSYPIAQSSNTRHNVAVAQVELFDFRFGSFCQYRAH